MILSNASVFISDLHLSPNDPNWRALLIPFLDDIASKSSKLYVLGDLFDWWIGDDIEPAFQAEVQQAFARLKDHGTSVYFIAGNRDFLLSNAFLKKAHCQRLRDPTLIDCHGVTTLIAHGDSLCTQDVAYQRYRKLAQSSFIRWLIPRLPRRFRCWLAQGLRAKSQTHQKNVAPSLLDVHPQAVIDLMAKKQVHQMIHGHVHRFATHQVPLPNGTKGTRYVLGDWGKKATTIIVTQDGITLAEYEPIEGLVPLEATTA